MLFRKFVLLDGQSQISGLRKMKRILFFLCCFLPLADVVAQNRWLTALDDTLLFVNLSIPGTHNAATSSLCGRGRCQALTIAEQLHVGVRAFDLRPTQRRKTDCLGGIYHGVKNTGVSLADAFDNFNDFLAMNPGEFIVVLLRDESDGRYLFRKPEARTFTQTLRDFLQTQPRVVDFRADLRLNDLRGGIVVLCRTGSPSDIASTYLSWNHSIEGSTTCRIYYDGSSAALSVQDCYSPKVVARDYGEMDFLQRKLVATQFFLDRTNVPDYSCVINYASAYVGRNNYCRVAEWINPRLTHQISTLKKSEEAGLPKTFFGILMMDFAGVDKVRFRGKIYDVGGASLLRAVIDHNF